MAGGHAEERQRARTEALAQHWVEPVPVEAPGDLLSMKTALPSQIESLFMRHPALCGFSVRGPAELPDNFPRSGSGCELFVGDIGISPAVSDHQFEEIFEEIVAALAEAVAEVPGFGESLRGRTFARVLH